MSSKAQPILHLRRWSVGNRGDVCPYCDGSGKAPSSDDRTPCGFCDGGRLT